MKRNKGRKTIFSDEQIDFMLDLLEDKYDKHPYKYRERMRNQIMKQAERLLYDLDFFILSMKHDQSTYTAAMSNTIKRTVKEYGSDLDKLDINWNYIVDLDSSEKQKFYKKR